MMSIADLLLHNPIAHQALPDDLKQQDYLYFYYQSKTLQCRPNPQYIELFGENWLAFFASRSQKWVRIY